MAGKAAGDEKDESNMANESSEWVRGGTPRDVEDEWSEEQSEYGTAVESDWDDYSSEQGVPAPQPRAASGADGGPAAQVESEPGTHPDAEPTTQPDGETATNPDVEPASPQPDPEPAPQPDAEPVPGQEPDAAGDYRSDQAPAEADPAPAETEVDPASPEVPPVGPSVDDTDRVEQQPDSQTAPEVPVEPTPGEEPTEPVPAGVADPFDEAARTDPAPVAADATDRDTLVPPTPDVDEEARVSEETADLPSADEPEATEDHMTFRDPSRAAGGAVADTETGAPEPVTAADETELPAGPEQELPEESGDETTEVDELEATQAVPVVGIPAVSGAGASAAVPGTTDMAGLYRDGDNFDETAVIAAPVTPEPAYPDDREAEERRVQAQLAAEREARERRLGVVATSTENEVRDTARPPRRVTDKFFGSFGLFCLRLVTAMLLGVAAYKILGGGIDRTTDFLAQQTLIPEPRLVAWILGFTLGGMAVLLVIGMFTRVVGFLLVVLVAATLALLRWGNFNIFDVQTEGFIGDKDLLLGAVGLLFLCLGGGGWGVDGAFRRSRANARARKLDLD